MRVMQPTVSINKVSLLIWATDYLSIPLDLDWTHYLKCGYLYGMQVANNNRTHNRDQENL